MVQPPTVRRTKGEGEPPVAHRCFDACGFGVDLFGVRKEPHIGFDACGERPRSVSTGLEEHGPHGVSVNDGEATLRCFNEQTSISIAVECCSDELAGRGRLQLAKHGVG